MMLTKRVEKGHTPVEVRSPEVTKTSRVCHQVVSRVLDLFENSGNLCAGHGQPRMTLDTDTATRITSLY